jgi:uncharacterized FlgJ-related protein
MAKWQNSRHIKIYRIFMMVVLAVITGISGVSAQKTDYNAVVNRYIQKYKEIAIREMHDYRIPASITLAQGILESNAGRSPLATEANNHFGIKCHKEWTGKTFIKDDETKNECFRKYDNPLESFRDHSCFLTQRDRYKNLFKLDITDYKGWATGLKAAGYATNPAYAELLIRTIEKYTLDRYDKGGGIVAADDSAMDQLSADQQAMMKQFMFLKSGPGGRKIYLNNKITVIMSRPDDDLYLIARDVDISVSRLLKYNDLA